MYYSWEAKKKINWSQFYHCIFLCENFYENKYFFVFLENISHTTSGTRNTSWEPLM